jgi:flagellar basal-body rod protein FlgC
MDYFSTFAVSASGLMVEKLRMETAALNLANADSTAAAGGDVFQAMTVVSRPAVSFESYMQAESTADASAMVTASLEPRLAAPRMVYDPSHPHADGSGFVAYSNVDSLTEMTTILRATRAYEANIKAINAAKAMAQQALEIGSAK